MKPQAYTEFQPLKQIVVGRSWDAKAIKSVSNLSDNNKHLITALLEETEEDYQKLINIIKTYGAKVHRPNYDNSSIIYNYPFLMTPRDWSIVFDNDLIIGNLSKGVAKRFAIGVAEHAEYFKRPKELLGFNPASIIRLGKDIIVDVQNNSNTESMVNYIKDIYEPLGYTIHGSKTFNAKFKNPMTHGDAVFAILKPGVILTTHPKNLYNNSLFKGWDVHIIENSKERSVFKEGWMQDKAKQNKDGAKTIKLGNGKTQTWSTNYRFDDKKFNNEEFTLYINKWFNNWVGYSSESIFDVNCLVLDESHVVFTNYNKGVWDFCKKHNIEPIICNFRHRWFWDGGLHCITVDIEREGSCEQYL
jgi:N-dimethylarginine dimethylaminohydrolase